MKRKVILVGNAVTANILYSYLQADDRYEVLGLTVDDEYVAQGGVPGLKAVGLSQVRQTFSPETCRIVMAVGYDNLNRVRESLFLRLKEWGYIAETYVHPDARVFTDQPLGQGALVLPFAVVEPHARLGDNSVVWSNVTVAHHSEVAENCWIASGAVIAGQARVLRNSFIGVNATIVDRVSVGEYNVVGAGALISKDTKPQTVHLARSAEPLRYSSDDYVKYFGV